MLAAQSEKSKISLLGLLFTQFTGAFNDNAWKVMVFTLATRPLVGNPEDFELSSQLLATLSLLVFLVPMMLFSLPAGALADKFSKRTILIMSKALEVILMAASTVSLFIAPTHLILPFALLGLMGAQSAIFGPAKYGIMPEILPEDKLSKGNGLLEMWTMLAIIVGTGLGPILLAADHAGMRPSMTWLGPLWLTLCSIAGFAGAFFIPRAPAFRPSARGMVSTIRDAWSAIRQDHGLWLAVLGTVFYWLITSLLGQNILVYAKTLVQDLEKSELLLGLPLAFYGVGIAAGAVIGGRMAGERIEYGFIPLGAIGFAVSSMLLGLLQPDMAGTIVILLLMGISSGFLIVPLNAIVQLQAPDDQRGSIIALGNVLNIAGMIIGSLAATGMALLGFDLGMMLILSACLVIAASAWSVRILPKALIRLCFIILTKTFYRLRIVGIERLPKSGPVLLACNHISVIDALFVMASVDRPVHFLMNEHYFNKWWMRPFARLLEAIPVSSTSNPRVLLEGVRKAGEYLDAGQAVCIFPEGQISHTGMMLPFKRGIELFTKGRDCPIVPIHLDQVWGSIFTFKDGRFFKKMPQQVPYAVSVSFGNPLPPTVSQFAVRSAIQELECDAWFLRKGAQVPLHRQFIRAVRLDPFRSALADEGKKKVRALKALAASISIARELKEIWQDQKRVGILLPASIPGILANIAAAVSGRTVVNLNFGAGPAVIEDAIKIAGVKSIITSRGFAAEVKFHPPESCRVFFIEDILTRIGIFKKAGALLASLFAPAGLVERYCGSCGPADVDDAAAVIFTSGSTGNPKGVAVSHFNISSNIDAVAQAIPYLGKQNSLLASLPFYHSFGYMMMWLGLNQKICLVVHPNPLDCKKIGELVKKRNVAMLMTAPSFLGRYLKQILPEQFGSLKCVMTGGEKLPERLSEGFEARFGIRPLEGYGATECSPVISISTLDVRQSGICQIGSKPGSVGQALPGVIIKAVDPVTFEELPQGSEGLLLIKGPNVALGYLGNEALSLAENDLKDGWFATGDIGAIDDGGFIRITDKQRRISNIQGQALPHVYLEQALHDAAEVDEKVFAVTAVPDMELGERLAVLHTFEESRLDEILNRIIRQGISNMHLPGIDHFIKVESLPLLPGGKLDLQRLKMMAMEMIT